MRLGLALAGLLIVLTGCGGADQRAPFADSRIPPSLAPRFWAPEGWGWGLIGVGDAPPQRYGVAAPSTAPRGALLILTDDGELAEAWFETVRDFNAAGYTVWVLERAGQGGSARYASPRDLIHVPNFEGDVAATKALARNIVESDRGLPLTIIGQGVGGLVALSAVDGGAPAAALVLSSPRLAPSSGKNKPMPAWLLRVGLGRLPEGVGQGWKRDGADAFKAGRTQDRRRGGVQMAWQTANPDLRMGGRSLGWTSAFEAESKAALGRAKDIRLPTHLLATRARPEGALAYRACGTMPRCTATGIEPPPGRPAAAPGASWFLGVDAVRLWWLDQVLCFAPQRSSAPEMPNRRNCPMDGVSPALSGHRL